LQTAAEMFLERNMDLSIQNLIPREACFHHQQHSDEKGLVPCVLLQQLSKNVFKPQNPEQTHDAEYVLLQTAVSYLSIHRITIPYSVPFNMQHVYHTEHHIIKTSVAVTYESVGRMTALSVSWCCITVVTNCFQ
jgi:hypothetical protein